MSLYLQSIGLAKLTRVPRGHFTEIENRRLFAKKLGEHLGYNCTNEWKNITVKQIKDFGGSGLLGHYYRDSPAAFVRDTVEGCGSFSDTDFKATPQGCWKKSENIKKWLEDLRLKMDWKEIDELHKLTYAIIQENGGGSIMHYYTIIEMLRTCYPGQSWIPERLTNLPNPVGGYWGNQENVRLWLTNLMLKKEWVTIDELHGMQQSDFITGEGSGLLQHYDGTYLKVLQFAYPEHIWDVRRFNYMPNGYWNNIENCRKAMQSLREKKKWETIDSLYDLQISDFIDNNLGGLLGKYDGTIVKVLSAIYPEIIWYPFLFKRSGNNWFLDETNRITAFKWFEHELKITDPIQWYDMCSSKLFLDSPVCGLMDYYHNSPTQLVASIYPELKWYMFKRAERESWNNKEKINEWFKDLLKFHSITNMENVYNLTNNDVILFSGHGGVKFGLVNIITTNIDYPWDITKFMNHGFSKASCRFMDKLSKAINKNIQHKLNGGEKLIPGTKFKADGFIEELNTVIEYHGCLFHGCKSCFTERSKTPWFSKGNTYEQLYEKTLKRTNTLICLGYKVVEMWECEECAVENLCEWFESKVPVLNASGSNREM